MVEFNTAAGQLGVYRRHIPLTTVLAPGIVTIHNDGEEPVIAAVHSGFAEILPDKVTLLAEIAEWPDEIDKNRAEAAKRRAEERLANRTGEIDIKRAEFALRKALVRRKMRSFQREAHVFLFLSYGKAPLRPNQSSSIGRYSS